MKTILHGPVSEQHLADAALFSGITPTPYITNGSASPPFGALVVNVMAPDPLVGEVAVLQSHVRMVLEADALICVGANKHLVRVAEAFDLLLYEAEH